MQEPNDNLLLLMQFVYVGVSIHLNWVEDLSNIFTIWAHWSIIVVHLQNYFTLGKPCRINNGQQFSKQKWRPRPVPWLSRYVRSIEFSNIKIAGKIGSVQRNWNKRWKKWGRVKNVILLLFYGGFDNKANNKDGAYWGMTKGGVYVLCTLGDDECIHF